MNEVLIAIGLWVLSCFIFVQAPLIKVSVPSEHKQRSKHVDAETSPEEFVLQELATVVAQVN